MPYATVLNVNKIRSKCLLVECRAGGSGKIEAFAADFVPYRFFVFGISADTCPLFLVALLAVTFVWIHQYCISPIARMCLAVTSCLAHRLLVDLGELIASGFL